jgi:hypothetical protein
MSSDNVSKDAIGRGWSARMLHLLLTSPHCSGPRCYIAAMLHAFLEWREIEYVVLIHVEFAKPPSQQRGSGQSGLPPPASTQARLLDKNAHIHFMCVAVNVRRFFKNAVSEHGRRDACSSLTVAPVVTDAMVREASFKVFDKSSSNVKQQAEYVRELFDAIALLHDPHYCEEPDEQERPALHTPMRRRGERKCKLHAWTVTKQSRDILRAIWLLHRDRIASGSAYAATLVLGAELNATVQQRDKCREWKLWLTERLANAHATLVKLACEQREIQTLQKIAQGHYMFEMEQSGRLSSRNLEWIREAVQSFSATTSQAYDEEHDGGFCATVREHAINAMGLAHATRSERTGLYAKWSRLNDAQTVLKALLLQAAAV